MKISFFLFMTLLATFPVYAQKLPVTQKTSIYLNKKVIVDGKATEINNNYEAFNTATQLYYTLQNDNTKLYLTVNIKDPEIIKKAIGGGITFSVNSSGKRNDTQTYGVTFPQMYYSDKSFIAKNINNIMRVTGDSTLKAKRIDSINLLNNKLLATAAKHILLTGIKSIPDSLISVYNEFGIKSAMSFDRKLGLTYELIVPLILINLNTDTNSKFMYNLMLNGVMSTSPGIIKQSTNGPVTVISTPKGFFNSQTFKDPALIYPTDFWGNYILAKK